MDLNSMDWRDRENKSFQNELVQSGIMETKYTSINASGQLELPIDMQFNDGHILSIVVYSILFVIATIGNITVLATLLRFRLRPRLSRINLFILHLVIADLFVTWILMPLEIGWASTVSWKAGDLACRILSFFRTFGLYLSGFLIVCIGLDRFFAVLKPLGLPEANRRGRIMLSFAWIGSIICSFPQALIFHVERHPKFSWFEQCVTFNSFPSKQAELAYSISGFILMYGFPLCMILFCYSRILYEIYKINRLSKQEGGDSMRRSNLGALGRAKVRTLKLTITIVLTFFLCWTPYNVMSLWYWIDKDSAEKVDQKIQKCLFLFACTNSCFNPMVYGLFHTRTKSLLVRLTGQQRNNIKQTFTARYFNQPDKNYKVRVRWTPRECLCGTASSSGYMSSSNNLRLRPLYEINGIPVYYSKLNGQGQIIFDKRYPQNSDTLIKTVQVDVNDSSKKDHKHINGRFSQDKTPEHVENFVGPKTLPFQRKFYPDSIPNQNHTTCLLEERFRETASSSKTLNCVIAESMKQSKTSIQLKNYSAPSSSKTTRKSTKGTSPTTSDKFWSAELCLPTCSASQKHVSINLSTPSVNNCSITPSKSQ